MSGGSASFPSSPFPLPTQPYFSLPSPIPLLHFPFLTSPHSLSSFPLFPHLSTLNGYSMPWSYASFTICSLNSRTVIPLAIMESIRVVQNYKQERITVYWDILGYATIKSVSVMQNYSRKFKVQHKNSSCTDTTHITHADTHADTHTHQISWD